MRQTTPDAAWHLLTGSGDTIAALTGAAGFRYVYDDATHQYAHPAGVLLLTPGGRIARYFFGFDFTPPQLRQAIEDASEERVASPAARLLLLCFHFDPAGKYSATILQALRWIAVAMLAVVLALVASRRRRGDEHRAARSSVPCGIFRSFPTAHRRWQPASTCCSSSGWRWRRWWRWRSRY